MLHRLDVQTQYLSHENLASFYVGTPDPCLEDPVIGQRLLIQWMLRSCEFEDQNAKLQFSVRFRNHVQEDMTIPIDKKRGFYLYDITNEKYCTTGGVLTYKVELINDCCVIAVWKHPLWTEFIQFSQKDSL